MNKYGHGWWMSPNGKWLIAHTPTHAYGCSVGPPVNSEYQHWLQTNGSLWLNQLYKWASTSRNRSLVVRMGEYKHQLQISSSQWLNHLYKEPLLIGNAQWWPAPMSMHGWVPASVTNQWLSVAKSSLQWPLLVGIVHWWPAPISMVGYYTPTSHDKHSPTIR